MIRSLDDAWNWYTAIKTLSHDINRLAAKWDDPALADVLGRDNRFRERTAADLQDMSRTILADLDDLTVLVLFWVFEATVREQAKADVDREITLIRHPAVLRAVKELKETIENGSFGRVVEAFQKIDEDLTAQVHQVRKFRNWVAHGRREAPENQVDPERANDRLRRYLDKLTELNAETTSTSPRILDVNSPTESP